MKLHTRLNHAQVMLALSIAKSKGHVAQDVQFTVFHGFGPYKGKPNAHGSLTHERAFEVQLGVPRTEPYVPLPKGTVNQQGRPQKTRRTTNQRNGNNWAATWHEWGWFMAEIFKMDQHALFGTVKGASQGWGYNGVDDFDEKTSYQFTEDE